MYTSIIQRVLYKYKNIIAHICVYHLSSYHQFVQAKKASKTSEARFYDFVCYEFYTVPTEIANILAIIRRMSSMPNMKLH